LVSDIALLPLHAVPAAHDPAAVCLVHDDARWRWADLDRRSAQWAARLIAHGVKPDDLVAFSLPNGPEFFAVTFGIYRAGATPAPLSPKLSEREMEEILDLMAPSAMIGAHAAMAGRALPPPDVDAPVATTGTIARSWKACTSGGSTGRPKVIVDGRPAGFTEATDFIAIPGCTVLVPGPLYHNAPFSAAVFALWKGARVVTMPRFDAEQALALIERERVSWAMMVPTMMHRILRLPASVLARYDLSCWKTVVHTASPIAADTKRRWIDRFGADHVWEVYGATEGLVRTWIGGADWLARPGSVGLPIGGARIRILDEQGEDVPVGDEGEVYAMPLGGAGSSYRYIGAERRATRDGWESVGDYGRLDADGYLYLADRRIDLIISGGVNIWPAEVEAAILEHPAIASCAVIGLPDDDLGARVHAVVETADVALSFEALRDFLRPRLAPEKLPRSASFTRDPIRDDAGKVRKSRLRHDLSETA
jgi:bile acid-coenzyme A ligase